MNTIIRDRAERRDRVTNARVIKRLNDRVDAKIFTALSGVQVPMMELYRIRKAALEAIAHNTDIDAAIDRVIAEIRVN